MNCTAFDTWYLQRSPFSLADKKKCITTIAELMDIAEEVRTHGILFFEEKIRTYKNYLTQKALLLMIDSTDEEVLYDILTDYVVACDYYGKDLLDSMIIIKGFVAMAKGFQPKVVREVCMALIGDDEYHEMVSKEVVKRLSKR